MSTRSKKIRSKNRELTPQQFLKTVNIDYDNLNNLPEFPGNHDAKDDAPLPYFFEEILDNSMMTYDSYKEFIKKFFLYYYFSDEFKEKVKNYYILLLNNQYSGVFKSIDEALKHAVEMNIPGFERIIIPITQDFEYIHKYETSISYGISRHLTDDNGEPINDISYPKLAVKVGINLDENNIPLRTERYEIDTGATTTTLSMLKRWDYKIGKYKEYNNKEFDIDENDSYDNDKSEINEFNFTSEDTIKTLTILNKRIIYKWPTIGCGIEGIHQKRFLIFFSPNVDIFINNIRLKIDKMSVRQAIKVPKNSDNDTETNSNNSSITDVMRNFFTKKEFKQDDDNFDYVDPKKESCLIGRNTLSQLNLNIYR
jgi:hypothetical protein